MATHRKIGIAIVLVPAIGAVIGLFTAHLSITVAVGIAVIGIVIGTGVARGNFSSTTSNSTPRKN